MIGSNHAKARRVGRAKFPLKRDNREYKREFSGFAAETGDSGKNTTSKSMGCDEIPVARQPGNFQTNWDLILRNREFTGMSRDRPRPRPVPGNQPRKSLPINPFIRYQALPPAAVVRNAKIILWQERGDEKIGLALIAVWVAMLAAEAGNAQSGQGGPDLP